MQDARGREREPVDRTEIELRREQDPRDDRRVEHHGSDGVHPHEVPRACRALRGEIPRRVRRGCEKNCEKSDYGHCPETEGCRLKAEGQSALRPTTIMK